MMTRKKTTIIASAILSLFSLGYGYFEYARQPEEKPAPIVQVQSFDASRIWSDTRHLSANDNAKEHFEKHGDEFALETEAEYVKAAIAFIKSPPQGTLQNIQRDGDTTFFYPKTGEFAVKTKHGRIRTYFILDPKIHGYNSNMDYFNAQSHGVANDNHKAERYSISK